MQYISQYWDVNRPYLAKEVWTPNALFSKQQARETAKIRQCFGSEFNLQDAQKYVVDLKSTHLP